MGLLKSGFLPHEQRNAPQVESVDEVDVSEVVSERTSMRGPQIARQVSPSQAKREVDQRTPNRSRHLPRVWVIALLAMTPCSGSNKPLFNKPIQISVRLAGTGETLTLVVKPKDTIKDVKVKIQDKEGFLPEQQQLKLTDTVDSPCLESWRTLYYYGITDQNNTMLYCSTAMQIKVKISAFKTLPLSVFPSDTVSRIKRRIERCSKCYKFFGTWNEWKNHTKPKNGKPSQCGSSSTLNQSQCEQQRLVLAACPLEGSRLLSSYEIQEGSVLTLTPMLIGVARTGTSPVHAIANNIFKSLHAADVDNDQTFTIDVKHSVTCKTYTIQVRSDDTVGSVLQEIRKAPGCNIELCIGLRGPGYCLDCGHSLTKKKCQDGDPARHEWTDSKFLRASVALSKYKIQQGTFLECGSAADLPGAKTTRCPKRISNRRKSWRAHTKKHDM